MHNRYTSAALKSNRKYALLAYTLSIVQHLEVVAEMIAIEAGKEKAKWNLVGLVELINLEGPPGFRKDTFGTVTELNRD
ncbi:hypothetical protein HDU97_007086 [Phlyctochytrium planicorne]|nr:hypothetical protein HDU97_007086 [Phlyctochytrium planicorne]